MRISDILHDKGSEVVTLAPTETIRRLVDLLAEHNLGAVVVSTDAGEVTGIVSERDVVRRLADGADMLELPVEQIMTPASALHTCTAEDSVESLRELMTEHRIRHVPVLDSEGGLAGIVSIGDVVKNRIGELQFQRDELEHYVSG